MPRNPNKIDYSGGFPQGFVVFEVVPGNGASGLLKLELV
jgi:hypothetical protein